MDIEGEKDNTREKLAELAHQIWSDWMKYLLSQTYAERGQFDVETKDRVIPSHLAERWNRQLTTRYKDLTQQEKASDRYIADRILNVLREDGTI